MAAEGKRKMPGDPEGNVGQPAKRRFEEQVKSQQGAVGDTEIPGNFAEAAPDADIPADDVAQRAHERQVRFKALQARQSQSRSMNRKETAAESQRLSVDPNLLNALSRKHAIASHKLLKADATAVGEDFERQRAWDWTIEESEKWDRRMEKKGKHREDVAFQDYRQEARKAYKRQMRDLKPNMEAYEKEKMAAVQRAADSGGLEVVETDDGELVAVDRTGAFYTTADSTDFVHNKPEKAAVDRLVDDLQKAEDARMRKRKERGRDDDGDVTYINEKNKVCLKLCKPESIVKIYFSNSTTSLNASTTSTPPRSATVSNEERRYEISSHCFYLLPSLSLLIRTCCVKVIGYQFGDCFCLHGYQHLLVPGQIEPVWK